MNQVSKMYSGKDKTMTRKKIPLSIFRKKLNF